MSLVKCSECNKEISSKAEVCPNCGIILIKKSHTAKWVALFVTLSLILSITIYLNISKKNNTDYSYLESIPSQIRHQFNSNGEHKYILKFLKRKMNDPESYQHVKTTYDLGETTVIVTTIYRGKNSYGGVIKREIVGTFNLQGQVHHISNL
jgi:RNA polymerase subunit RPABC4/transcription elongation factor Spt4